MLGIFVVFGALLFAIATFFVGNNETLFQRSFLLHTEFGDTGGLKKGDNVWLSGVKIGTVSHVDISSDSGVDVTLRIRRKYLDYISKDVQAEIGRDGVMGNRIVILHNGVSDTLVHVNQVIASLTNDATGDILSTLKKSGQNVLDITQNMKEITEDIKQGHGLIGELLTNEKWAAKVDRALTRMEITTSNTAVITGDLSAITDELKRNKKGIIATLVTDTSFSKIYHESLAHIQLTSENAAVVSGDFRKVGEELKRKDNTVGLVLTDTAFASELRRSNKALREDLEAAQHSFLLKGYFRKKEKEAAKTNGKK